jgi:hypothetical protein
VALALSFGKRKKMRVAIYARVSTANNGQDPTMQTRELREYAERRGWTVAGEYVDVGISGTKEKRPELDRLMTDAHRRRFDAVVVWKFDRFARSVGFGFFVWGFRTPLTSGSPLTVAGKLHRGSRKIVLAVPPASPGPGAWSRTSIPPLAGS